VILKVKSNEKGLHINLPPTAHQYIELGWY